MSKVKKIFLRVIPVVLVLLVIVSGNVFGFSNFKTSKVGVTGTTEGMDTANDAIKRIWGTITLILQILAVAAIVIAGIRYMFASADAKADIKKQTIGLVVGAILVFAASTVVGFIVDVVKQVAPKTEEDAYNNLYEIKESRFIS